MSLLAWNTLAQYFSDRQDRIGSRGNGWGAPRPQGRFSAFLMAVDEVSFLLAAAAGSNLLVKCAGGAAVEGGQAGENI